MAASSHPNMDPNEKSDLIKLIEKYGYNMHAQQGGGYSTTGVQNIFLPLGANDPDEDVLKALGFEKTGNSKH